MSDDGSVAPQFLFVLIFLSILAVGLGRFLSATALYERGSRLRFSANKELMEAIPSALKAMKEDPTPEADGRLDPLQELNGKTINGITLSIVDRSSALNANFVEENVFEKTALSSLLALGRSGDELQQYREDSGLSISDTHYAAFFQSDAFRSRITTYGWANINVTDEFALSSLVASITGSKSKGEDLRFRIWPLRIAHVMVTRDSLKTFLGTNYADYFPLISAEPTMNVNFVDPFILKELLKYPDYKLQSPAAKAERILTERELHEIDEEDLKSILEVDDENRLLHYFGSRTWFWEVTAEKDGGRCVLIICRYPDEGGGSTAAPRFEVVESRFEP